MEAGIAVRRGKGMTIIFLLEERSMKEVLDIILPQILPTEVYFKTIAHSGKSDLQESWYFGDLQAVSKAYGQDVSGMAAKSKFRNPDEIRNPKEELRKLFPKHQQLDGARRIAVHMSVEKNTSLSFQCFVSGVQKLCTAAYMDRV